MIVRYSESVEIPQERRYDVFAYAGHLLVYKNGMKTRDCVKAIMSVVGTSWVEKLNEMYPLGHHKPARRRRQHAKKVEAGNGKV